MVKSSKNLVAIILLSGSFLAFCMSVTAQESGPPTTSQEQAMNQLNTVPKDFETEIIVADEKGRKRAEFLIEVYKSLASDPTIENVKKYVRDDYVQHSPMLPDGPQGLAMFFRSSVVQYGTEIDVHRIIVVGNYAVAHVNFRKLTTSDPDDLGMPAVDIYTFGPDGKLAEHWDAVQGVPTYSVNPHGMFIRVLKD